MKDPIAKLRGQETYFARTGFVSAFANPKVMEKVRAAYEARTGFSHNSKNPEVIKKRKDNYKLKTGYDHQSCDPAVAAKKRETMLRKFGHAYTFNVPEIRKSITKTLVRTTGFASASQSPLVKAKKKAASLRRFGTENPMQAAEVKKKVKETFVKNWGYSHPMKNPEFFNSRGTFNRKLWIAPDGKEHHVQGCEPLVLDHLVINGVSKIITGSGIPSIPYGSSGRVYHADAAFISPTGRKYLLESKSTYTLQAARAINLAKFRAANKFCSASGMTFVLAVQVKKDVVLIPRPSAKRIHDFLSPFI